MTDEKAEFRRRSVRAVEHLFPVLFPSRDVASGGNAMTDDELALFVAQFAPMLKASGWRSPARSAAERGRTAADANVVARETAAAPLTARYDCLPASDVISQVTA